MTPSASRNTLLTYARRRVDETVLAPLHAEGAHDSFVISETLERLRQHFRGLWIELGPLVVQDGAATVEIGEMPR